MNAEYHHARLSGTAVLILAVAAGGAIANDYAMQPSLSAIATGFNVPVTMLTAAASATMVGYLIGLVLLVPLVDRFSPRVLIPTQMAALACALALAAFAPGPVVLVCCLVFVGAATTVAAQCSATVGKYADPQRRAYSMGAVSAGISAGILLSRFIGGLLTQWLGWRGALLIFAAGTAIAALGVRPILPATLPAAHNSYFSTLRAIPALLKESAQLRHRSGIGMLWFFSFNLIWVALAVRLAAPPYSLSAAAIGLYSLAGVLGLVVTRLAGRLTDRFGDRTVIVSGLSLAGLSAIALTVAIGHPLWAATALAFFDAGCFAAQVANQSSTVALNPARSGALNATYLTLYYAAGALGSAVAGPMIVNMGWLAICLTATLAVVIALFLSIRSKAENRG